MLKALTIKNIVLIERLSLTLGQGLTALTGETGAGKSILLDAIGLAVGGKGDRGLVRHGAEHGEVEAVFELRADHPARALADLQGLRLEGAEVRFLRHQYKDGKTRAWIDGQSCSVAALRQVGSAIVEMHGQNQTLEWLQPQVQRELLDAFGRLGRDRSAVSLAYRRWQQALSAAAAHKKRIEETLREEDYLRHIVSELETLAPKEGEEALLAEQRARMMAREKAMSDIGDAIDGLTNGDMSSPLSQAAGAITRAMSRVEGEEKAELEKVFEQLDLAINEIEAARHAVAQLGDRFDLDAEELNSTEERLFALRAAARKNGCTPDELHEIYHRSQQGLEALENARDLATTLDDAADERKEAYLQNAEKLSQGRKRAAKRLCAKVIKELGPLKLGDAVFEVKIVPTLKPSENGVDGIVFGLSANAGIPSMPLGSVASGGELSRIVLALKAVLATVREKSVMIFDEVDAGVGGAVADAVGERLGRIAHRGQVLVVTHSPQVAARADHHFHTSKKRTKTVATKIVRLAPAQRVEEIARMLSGAVVTDLARQAASELLEGRKVQKRALANESNAAKTAA